MSTGSTRYVEAGACLNANGTFQRCALEKTQCNGEAGETFLSSRELKNLPTTTTTSTTTSRRELYCLTAQLTEASNVGRCGSNLDKGLCTSVRDACQMKDRFEELHPHCSVVGNDQTGAHSQRALYPACHNPKESGGDRNMYKTCVWRRDDCPPDEDFWTALTAWGMGDDGPCTCDRVRVGVCVHGNEYHCGVSSDACDDSSVFWTVREMHEQRDGPGIDCRLCRPLPVGTPNPIVFLPTNNNNVGSVLANGIDGKQQQPPRVLALVSSGFLGGVVATCLVVGLVALFNARNRNATEKRQASAMGFERSDDQDTTTTPHPVATDLPVPVLA